MITAKLRGSYGRSTRPPTAGQKIANFVLPASYTPIYGPNVYQQLASPDLGPEFQQGGEGGMELYLGNRGSLVITRYNQTVDNLIRSIGSADSVRALAPGIDAGGICSASSLRSDGYCYMTQSVYANVGSIRNQGWETQGSVNAGPFTTRGTYSWTKSRMIGITPQYQAKFATSMPLQRGWAFNILPEHTWALTTSYARSGEALSLTVNGVGKKLLNTTSAPYFSIIANGATNVRDLAGLPRSNIPFAYRPVGKGYETASFNASHRFSQTVEATLDVSNLTDHYQNDSNAYYPIQGRQTNLGLRLRL
jgi:hypothetical protein